MKRLLIAIVVAVAAAAAIVYLLRPDCADMTKEPVGARQAVECKS